MLSPIRSRMFIHRGKVHKDKKIMGYVHFFQNMKSLLTFNNHNFFIWLGIECCQHPLVLWLKFHLNSLKTLIKRCTIIKPLNFELLRVHSPIVLPYCYEFILWKLSSI